MPKRNYSPIDNLYEISSVRLGFHDCRIKWGRNCHVLRADKNPDIPCDAGGAFSPSPTVPDIIINRTDNIKIDTEVFIHELAHAMEEIVTPVMDSEIFAHLMAHMLMEILTANEFVITADTEKFVPVIGFRKLQILHYDHIYSFKKSQKKPQENCLYEKSHPQMLHNRIVYFDEKDRNEICTRLIAEKLFYHVFMLSDSYPDEIIENYFIEFIYRIFKDNGVYLCKKR